MRDGGHARGVEEAVKEVVDEVMEREEEEVENSTAVLVAVTAGATVEVAELVGVGATIGAVIAASLLGVDAVARISFKRASVSGPTRPVCSMACASCHRCTARSVRGPK